ncbi:MAG: site-specific integrase [Desulfomonilaceae bacterium]
MTPDPNPVTSRTRFRPGLRKITTLSNNLLDGNTKGQYHRYILFDGLQGRTIVGRLLTQATALFALSNYSDNPARQVNLFLNSHPISVNTIRLSTPLSKMNATVLLESFYIGKSERTIEAYRRDLDDFRQFLGVDNMTEAARVFLSEQGKANGIALSYAQRLIEKGLQSTTINRRLAALRSLSQMAKMLGMIPWTLQVKNRKVEAYRDTKGPGIDNFKEILTPYGSEGGRKRNKR